LLIPNDDLTYTLIPTNDLTHTLIPNNDLLYTLVPDGDLNYVLLPDNDLNPVEIPINDINYTLIPNTDLTYTLIPNNDIESIVLKPGASFYGYVIFGEQPDICYGCDGCETLYVVGDGPTFCESNVFVTNGDGFGFSGYGYISYGGYVKSVNLNNTNIATYRTDCEVCPELPIDENGYRYYKWEITDTKTTDYYTQSSEFVFTINGTNQVMSGVTMSNPGAMNLIDDVEGANKIIDGDLNTKWLDSISSQYGSKATLIFDFGEQKIFTGYKWATGNDYEERDPKNWKVFGSNDNVNYTTLSTVSGYTSTSDRNTFNIEMDFDYAFTPPTPTPTPTSTPSPTPTSTPTPTPTSTPTPTQSPLDFTFTAECDPQGTNITNFSGGSGQWEYTANVFGSENEALNAGLWYTVANSWNNVGVQTNSDGTYWAAVRDLNNPSNIIAKSVTISCVTPTPTPTPTSTPTPTPTPEMVTLNIDLAYGIDSFSFGGVTYTSDTTINVIRNQTYTAICGSSFFSTFTGTGLAPLVQNASNIAVTVTGSTATLNVVSTLPEPTPTPTPTNTPTPTPTSTSTPTPTPTLPPLNFSISGTCNNNGSIRLSDFVGSASNNYQYSAGTHTTENSALNASSWGPIIGGNIGSVIIGSSGTYWVAVRETENPSNIIAKSATINCVAGLGLVLHYDPSNTTSYSGTGTTINDLTGQGRVGTMSNITHTSPYFTFNGTSSQISVADSIGLEPQSGDWTVEVWVNQTVAGNDVVLGKFNTGGLSSNVGYSIRTTGSSFYAQYGSGSGSGSTLFSNSTTHNGTVNTWYQLVYVFTNIAANTFETFVNGTSIGSVNHSLASILNTTTNLYIGSYNNGEYAQWFDGKIGIVRIYGKALTAAEVLGNYNTDKSKYGL
jgi:hypothetical protein